MRDLLGGFSPCQVGSSVFLGVVERQVIGQWRQAIDCLDAGRHAACMMGAYSSTME
jgi:hypothetical protein